VKRSAGFDVDADLIRKLAELLGETGLTEIECAEGDRRIRVARAPAATAAAMVAPAPAPPAAGDASAAPDEAPTAANGAVLSPIVGTVYLSAQPNVAPFIKAGDTVAAGDTLMIVEAMKVMNPITAPQSGVVRAILVEDGAPVEFGQPLVLLA